MQRKTVSVGVTAVMAGMCAGVFGIQGTLWADKLDANSEKIVSPRSGWGEPKAVLSSLAILTSADLSVQQEKVDLLYKAVPEGDWTYAAVERLMHRSVIRGYPYSFFFGKPLRTRYDFAVAILRSAVTYAQAVKQRETPAKVSPWQEGDEQGGPVAPPPAEDLKLLRKLHLEFKAQVAVLGEDWTATDGYLQKMQDQVLHRELTEALAAGLPKTDDAAPGIGAKVVLRPNWAYIALKQLLHTKDATVPEDRLLTRAEFAGIVEREVDPFRKTIWTRDANTDPISPEPPYTLSEVTAMHKLLHAFRFEIAPAERVIRLDTNALEHRCVQEEEKLIGEEEIIDTKPPVLPKNP